MPFTNLSNLLDLCPSYFTEVLVIVHVQGYLNFLKEFNVQMKFEFLKHL